MIRCDFGVPFWQAPYGFIGIYQHSHRRNIDLTVDLDRLRAALVNEKKSDGMILNSERKIETGVGTAYCFEFKSERRSGVNCYFDKSSLNVEYEGSEKFAGDIYELVNSARWQSGAPIPPPGLASMESR
jgi:hypothetical protein